MGEGRNRGRQFEQQRGTASPQANEPASAVPAQEPGAGASGGAHRQAQASGVGAILRLWWMFVGTAVFVFSGVYIGVGGRGWRLSPVDVVFWAAAVSLLVARFLDMG